MRYALHKMLVMAEREDRFQDKLRKDATQVAALLQWGLKHGKRQLEAAAEDIRNRGPGWRKRLKDGLEMLASYHPHEAAGVAPMLQLPAPRDRTMMSHLTTAPFPEVSRPSTVQCVLREAGLRTTVTAKNH